MANARTKFDFIVGYMTRAHGAVQTAMFGRPTLMLNGEPFMVFHYDGMAFRLCGRQRLQASALSGAKYWEPIDRRTLSMDWISVPNAHASRWDRLAIDALHQRKNDKRFQPIAEPVKEPPIPPPASLRWADNIKLLLTKIQNLHLVARESVDNDAPR